MSVHFPHTSPEVQRRIDEFMAGLNQADEIHRQGEEQRKEIEEASQQH